MPSRSSAGLDQIGAGGHADVVDVGEQPDRKHITAGVALRAALVGKFELSSPKGETL
jgi:hypothetical protein